MSVYFLLKNKLFLTAILIFSLAYSQNQIARVVLPNLGGDDNLLLEQELIAQEPSPLLMPSTTPLFDKPTTSISTGSQVINFGDTAAGVSIGASSSNLKFQDEDYLARLGIEYASPNSNFGYGVRFDAATLITSSFALGINAKGYSNLKEIVLGGVWIPENSHWKMKLSTAYMWGNRNFNFYSGSENANLNQASYFFSANYTPSEETSDYIHTFGFSNWGSKANQTNLSRPVYVISENTSTMDPLKLSTGTVKGTSLDTQLGIANQIVTKISLGYESIELPFSDGTQELDNVFFQNYLVQYQPTQEIILQADYKIGVAEKNISFSSSYGQWKLGIFKNHGNNGVLSNQGILLTYGISWGGENNAAPLNILVRPNDIRSSSLALRDAMTRPVQFPQNFLAKVDSTATTTTTLTVAEVTPTLTGFALSSASVAYGASAPTITAPSSASGGAITYASSDTAVASVNESDSTITLVGAGSTTFTATQAADGNYTSATTTTTLTVTAATPTLTGFALSSASVAYGASAPTITPPSSDSGGAITYTSRDTAVATVTGSTITLVGAGSTTFTATQAADGNYTSATTTTTLTVTAVTPTLTGFALSSASVAYGASAPTITPPSSASGGAITYASSDTAVATVSGSTITLVGAGSTTFTATQAADGNYTSATTTTTLTVTAATPTLTGFALSSASVAYGASAPTITPPSSASGGAITYASRDTAVATVSGSTITLVGAGSTTFTATQAADGNYTSATTTTTLTVTAATSDTDRLCIKLRKRSLWCQCTYNYCAFIRQWWGNYLRQQ